MSKRTPAAPRGTKITAKRDPRYPSTYWILRGGKRVGSVYFLSDYGEPKWYTDIGGELLGRNMTKADAMYDLRQLTPENWEALSAEYQRSERGRAKMLADDPNHPAHEFEHTIYPGLLVYIDTASQRHPNPPTGPHTIPRATNSPARHEWVLLGAAVEVLEGGKVVDLRGYLLVIDPARELVLVKPSGRKGAAKPSKAAARAWRKRTLEKAQRGTIEAAQPERGPWRKAARVEAIHYTGNLQGEHDDYRHVFTKPFPLLQRGPDGFRIVRSGSGYTVSERGIIG